MQRVKQRRERVIRIAERLVAAKRKGWTEESYRRWWKTMVGDAKHPVTKCIKKVKQSEGFNPSDPGAFCAAMADKAIGKSWRKKKKKTARRI